MLRVRTGPIRIGRVRSSAFESVSRAYHGRAGSRQYLGDALADTTAGPRDHGDIGRQIEQIKTHHQLPRCIATAGQQARPECVVDGKATGATAGVGISLTG